MDINDSLGRKIFLLCNNVFLIVLAVVCLLPLINILALSFSSSSAATAGAVKLWPVDFTLSSYKYALSKPEFLQSLLVSIKRVVLGTIISLAVVIISAYPLSKERADFPMRTFYVWFFFVTILFSGGLIPTYMVIRNYHMLDTIWALVLPGAVAVFNIVLLLNFFRGTPKEIQEAAFVDGCTHWQLLWKIMVPISMPALATILLFTCVGQWNSWFDGLIYMNSPANYPLQTYLQTLVVSTELFTAGGNLTAEDMKALAEVSDRTTKASQIFMAAMPVLVLYPFLQKYFMKGIVLGSVKG
ncbi:carbohydrate ABC transporter permease [Paenibacillus contaminans]|uniref:Carbohydrate ABC transporter permease n=1 Tax=Paenibacillus contaminans TaxID=450362 RepID=A0A329MH59_9BACL|nr:carbohydrate ABC transporter permease [Paenibacillus contaminans]RAV16697.1 carbohydrate ABC transporter permease [Paenibacillus contaminans]